MYSTESQLPVVLNKNLLIREKTEMGWDQRNKGWKCFFLEGYHLLSCAWFKCFLEMTLARFSCRIVVCPKDLTYRSLPCSSASLNCSPCLLVPFVLQRSTPWNTRELRQYSSVTVTSLGHSCSHPSAHLTASSLTSSESTGLFMRCSGLHRAVQKYTWWWIISA